ncbi:MAG: DUF6788 family protein [Acidimicrobiia bacterium]
MPKKETKRPWEATRRALAGQLAEIDGVLPGSVVVRNMRCGKSGCACHDDPPTLHGPYIQWTRAVGGKTVTRYLSEEELARYQPWFDNARRLKEIAAKLEIASLHALEIEQSAKPNSPNPGGDPTRRVTRRRPPPPGA